MNKDEIFMTRAIELAKKGIGKVLSNPVVGAVVVKGGCVISEGWHEKFGSDHAEVITLNRAGKKARNATLYITLEPCCHFGHTPPCTDAIIKSGIREVVIAMKDPSKHANGKGIEILKKAGVKVKIGVCEKNAREINQVFLKNVLKGLPYVTLKTAMSLDGKIATRTGDSRGISCRESLKFVHKLRAENDAVLVGIGTVLADNPHLGVRFVKGKSPVRVILDPEFKTPLSAQVLRDKNAIIFVSKNISQTKIKKIEAKCRVIKSSSFEIGFILKILFALGIRSVLVEGGEKVFTSFLEAGAADRYIAIIALKLIGGEKAKTGFAGKGVSKIAGAYKLKNVSIKTLGEDVIAEGILKKY